MQFILARRHTVPNPTESNPTQSIAFPSTYPYNRNPPPYIQMRPDSSSHTMAAFVPSLPLVRLGHSHAFRQRTALQRCAVPARSFRVSFTSLLPRCSASSSSDEDTAAGDEQQSKSLVATISQVVNVNTKNGRLVRVLLLAVVSLGFRAVNPAFAATAGALGPLAKLTAVMESSSFLSGLAASFLLVLASEIGDKTFFISALLSMKYSRVLVLIGTMMALASMTVISVGIGQIFHALPSSLNSTIPFDDYAAVALLLFFGWQNIRDGLAMKEDDDDELQDAKETLSEKGTDSNQQSSGVRVVAETSSLIFLAEWGDKSMLATVALAAAKNPWGVIVGGISGHLIASIIAVIGGSVLGKFISERNARLIGGVLFFVFAILTILGIY